MTHDIAHCKGNGCPIRDNCYRYQAHLEVVSGKYQSMRISYFVDDYLCQEAKRYQLLRLFTNEELKAELKRRNEEMRKERNSVLRCRTCAHYGTINYWGKPTGRGETSCCPFVKIKSGKHYRVIPEYNKACDKYESLKTQ